VASAKAKVQPKKQEEDEGAPAWMVTYGDMMSLLLTFFVLLVSMSVIREEQFEAAKKSIREVFIDGYWLKTRDIIVDEQQQVQQRETTPNAGFKGPDTTAETEVQRIKQKIDARLKELGLGGIVISYLNVREVRIRIPNRILFGVDSAELTDPFAYEVLHEIAMVLKDIPYCINIEGHTADRDVVSGQFKDLWELSTARALTVLRYFEKNDIASRRLSAVGHGATRPIEENNTFRQRAMNRRVEIVVRDVTPDQLDERPASDRGR
jgi:chemotaxis protein MotB